jgi:LysM repeat protein
MESSKYRIAYCYHSLFYLLIVFYLASCGVGRNVPIQPEPAPAVSTKQQEIVNFGKQFLGVRYRFGGRTPSGFDCSGFTVYVFRQFGITLNATSSTQDTQFPTVYRQQDLRVGDLVFFEGRTRNGRVGHVGIVTENRPNYFRFIHASVSRGVTVSRSTEQYWAVRYLRGGRVLPNEVQVASNQRARTNASSPPPPTRRTRNATNQRTRFANNNQNSALVPATAAHQASVQTNANEPIILVNQTNNPPFDNRPANSNERQPIVLINNDVVRREDNPVPAPVAANEGQRTHTVQSGETLFSISRQYNVTVEQLRQWNPQVEDVLLTGETLIIR